MHLFSRNSLLALLVSSLAGCGGGGGGSTPPPPPPPVTAPSGLSYSAPPQFVVGTAIAQLAPTVTGTPTSYTISPALSAGLTLNGTTGVVSGTPTAPAAFTTYTVTASNAGGSATSGINVTVIDVAPNIDYPSATYVLETGQAANILPMISGGTVVTWIINRTLPAGLVFNTTNGQITGSPTVNSANFEYEITARNSGGEDTFEMNLSIVTIPSAADKVFDLGHNEPILTQYSGQRLLTYDGDDAVLWNSQTGERIVRIPVSTISGCSLACYPPHALLAGSIMLLRRNEGWGLYSSVDGSFISTIAVPSLTEATLASDGSYALVWGSRTFWVYSSMGSLLLTRTGSIASLSGAQFFAAPGEIRIANGPAGDHVIETVPISGTASVSTAFNGSFAGWFADGARFLTKTGNTVRVYSSTAVQQDISALDTVEGLAGWGDYFWTLGSSNHLLRLYSVGASATPVQTYDLGSEVLLVNSANTLAALRSGERTFSVVDLSGSTPQIADYTAPVASLSSFAALSATDWVIGNGDGVLIAGLAGGTARYFSEGRARGFAGSANRAAVSTSAGNVLIFNATNRTLESQIPFSASKLALSADGSVLVAVANSDDAQYLTDRSLRVYSLPSRILIKEWPYTFAQATQWPHDFSVSASGQVVAQIFGAYFGAPGTVTRQVTLLDDTVLWNDSRNVGNPSQMPVRLSSNGMILAAPDNSRGTGTTTNIYTNGTLTGAALGWPLAWLDDSHLLVNRYSGSAQGSNVGFLGADIVDPTGHVLSSPPLQRLDEIQVVDSGHVYSPALNIIVDVNTGGTHWSTLSPTANGPIKGTVAGNYVFFASGPTIRAEPR